MSARTLYRSLISALVLLGIGLFIGAYAINSLFEKRAAQLTKQQQELAVLRVQESELKRAKADIEKYRGLADIAKNIVPQDKDQARAVREITKLASKNGIELNNVSFPTSTLGAGTVKKKATPALSQLTSVKGIPGVYNLEITVQTDTKNPVPYTSFLGFLRDLEQNRRTALVSSIVITPDVEDPSLVSFSLILQEYIKP